MTSATFATHPLPASQQFEAWHSWYASVFDTSPGQSTAEGFGARTAASILDGFGFSRVSSPPLSMTRNKTLIRRNPVDHWCISLGKNCATDLEVGNAALVVPPRVPCVFSLGEEMYSERKGDRIQLYLARDKFQEIASLLDVARGKAIDTPEGLLLSGYMLLLERNIPQLSATDGPKLAKAIQSMVSACLAPTADRLAAASRHIDLTLMERVRQAVGRNLRSPAFGPDKLCRQAATSRSQLYRLLEGEGGVAHYIQRRRLSESFSLLCDPSNGFSIGKVAEMLCFADGSSFSRAFRREFGMSPSDVRAHSLVGMPPTLPPRRVGATGVHSYGEYLRSL